MHFFFVPCDANKLAFVNDCTWIGKSSYHLNGWNSQDDCFYCPAWNVEDLHMTLHGSVNAIQNALKGILKEILVNILYRK